MIHFNCPHCQHEFNDIALFNQEVPLLEHEIYLGSCEEWTLSCENCQEQFILKRTIKVEFSAELINE